MNLPVVNRKKASSHINRIVFLMVFLYFIFYFLTKSWTVIFYFTIFNILVSVLLIRYYRKNKFSVSFNGKELIVRHLGKVLHIPATEIWDVKNEINNYLGEEPWRLAVVYTLYLRRVYSFGDEIHLSYLFSKENLENGPEFIQQLRELLKDDSGHEK